MKRIMVVDDEEMILMLTQNILSSNYEVVCAGSGQEAIDKYGLVQPDMVISDLMMPGMDGFEMLSKMREQYGRHIPIIFMTAHEGEENELKSLTSGAVEFIRKPLKANALLTTVNGIMARLDAARGF